MKSVRQIIELYNNSWENAKSDGLLWYKEAAQYARGLATKYNMDFHIVCGVISSLSPSNEWNNNKREADSLLKAWKNDTGLKMLKFRTYARNVSKAVAILDSDGSPLTIYKILLGVKGYKTASFYNNIAFYEMYGSVTIDRHMLTILEEDHVKSEPHYRKMENLFQKAALELNILPHQLQAVLWCNHLENQKPENKYDEIPF